MIADVHLAREKWHCPEGHLFAGSHEAVSRLPSFLMTSKIILNDAQEEPRVGDPPN